MNHPPSIFQPDPDDSHTFVMDDTENELAVLVDDDDGDPLEFVWSGVPDELLIRGPDSTALGNGVYQSRLTFAYDEDMSGRSVNVVVFDDDSYTDYEWLIELVN